MAHPPSEVQTTLNFQRKLLEAPDFDAFLQDNATQMVTPGFAIPRRSRAGKRG